MTEPTTPAETCWPSGDQPGELVFQRPVAPEVAAALRELLRSYIEGADQAQFVALLPPVGAVGRYRLQVPGRTWFLRVTTEWNEPELEQALTAWLRDSGVSVNHLEFAGIPFDYHGRRHRVDLREFIHGHHSDNSMEEVRALAVVLGKCHAAMRTFPQAERVREFAARRFEGLSRNCDAIAKAIDEGDWRKVANDDWAAVNREWLEGMLRGYYRQFDQRPGAQIVHVQVHRANVIYTATHQPVLVDFEDATQTFAPIGWDLGFLVQRFCLHDEPSEAVTHQRLAMVREAYGAPLAGLTEMMRQTAWYSIAMLTGFQLRGVPSPRAEYDKFIRLERQACRYASVLDTYA